MNIAICFKSCENYCDDFCYYCCCVDVLKDKNKEEENNEENNEENKKEEKNNEENNEENKNEEKNNEEDYEILTKEELLKDEKDSICAICMEPIQGKTLKIVKTTSCKTLFHENCLIKWINSEQTLIKGGLSTKVKHDTCPICVRHFKRKDKKHIAK